MSPTRQNLIELFHHASGLAQDERREFLEQLRAETPKLARELLALLAEDAADGPIPLEPTSHPAPADALLHDESEGILAQVDDLRELTPNKPRYVLEEEIARGGMGSILRVKDLALRRELAMKVALDDPAAQAGSSATLGRFLEEAQVTGQLDHPGVVPVHELGVDADGRVYFTMRLVRGSTLGEVFERSRQGTEGWSQVRVLGVLQRVCEAMAYAHAKGVVHRDLKPANVMVGRFGEVYVMDWGVARIEGQPDHHDLRPRPAEADGSRPVDVDTPVLTMDGMVIGTPTYMSPEQAAGQRARVDARSDVYAVGAMMYELFAGTPPYEAELEDASAYSLLARVIQGPPRPLSELARATPAELVAITEKAMARDPAQRYRDMSELAADLQAYLEGRVVAAYEAGAWAEARKWVLRNKMLASTAAAAVVIALGGLGSTGYVQARGRKAEEAQRILAEANEKEARRQEGIARQNEERAQRNEEAARQQARIATEERANVFRLSAFQQLADLKAEADELWPAHPEHLQAYTDWLERAQELVSDLPRHRSTLQQLRLRAREPTAREEQRDSLDDPRRADLAVIQRRIEDLEATLASLIDRDGPEDQVSRAENELGESLARVEVLEEELREPWRFRFDSEQDRWWHAQLVKLVAELEAFSDPKTGWIEGTSSEVGWGIARRRAWAETVANLSVSGPVAARSWSEAIASIATPEELPAYGGLRIKPQIGLLPIGRDPESGLWEFAHLQSGEAPARGADGKLVLEESMGIVFVLLPGGTFQMGASRDDERDSVGLIELPVHAVTLSPFFLSKYELTQGQWRRLHGHNPSAYGPEGVHALEWSRERAPPSYLEPVENVSWTECARAMRRLGLALPSEAQWEYGARGGTQTAWSSGAQSRSLEGYANVADLYLKRNGPPGWGYDDWADGWEIQAPVGRFLPNPFGLHDVHGNVFEWCQDSLNAEFYGLSEGAVDPVWESPSASVRARRGGGFSVSSHLARSSFRQFNDPSLTERDTGLRPARALVR